MEITPRSEDHGDLLNGLEAAAVHVWSFSTQSQHAAHSYALLSDKERTRAERFKFAEHRRRYVVAHAAVRQILGQYLEQDARSLEFHEGAQGKPALVLTADQPPIQFNLSHSHEAALVAVTLARPVGVDVEYIRRDFDWEGIVENYFAAGEIAGLNALPEHLRQQAFFAIWTRKESYIKAKGGGLSIPLDGFEVSVHPNEPAALLRCAADAQEAANWSMTKLAVGSEYAATLCAAVPVTAVRMRTWPG